MSEHSSAYSNEGDLEGLRASLDETRDYAPAWRPEPGDVLVGSVERIDRRVSEFHGDGYTILTVATPEEGRAAVHAIHRVLAQDLAPAKVGDLIAVRYDGLETSAAGKSYHAYTVRISSASSGTP